MKIITNLLTAALAVLGAAVIVCVFAFVLSLPLMWLWNWLMPAIFGLCKIKWTQALGLLVLSGLLFKSSSSNS